MHNVSVCPLANTCIVFLDVSEDNLRRPPAERKIYRKISIAVSSCLIVLGIISAVSLIIMVIKGILYIKTGIDIYNNIAGSENGTLLTTVFNTLKQDINSTTPTTTLT